MTDLDTIAVALPPVLRLAEGAVLEGGGEYVGIQLGSRHMGIPDMVLFNDPITRTTLALVVSTTPVTARHVRAKIARSRIAFEKALRRGDSTLRLPVPRQNSWSKQAALHD